MTEGIDPTKHAAAMPDSFDIVYDRGNWPIIALAALALGIALAVGAAVMLARTGDEHE